MYQDGLQVFTFNFTDEKESPLPSTAFDLIQLGWNMRGLITDIQVYDEHKDGDFLSSWTSQCGNKPGNIFSWNQKKINIKQVGFFQICKLISAKISFS